MRKTVEKLLKKHPEARKEVQGFFLSKLSDTIDDKMPEDFKKFVKAQTVDDDKLATLMTNSPRCLFDVFDKHDIYINIVYQDEVGFIWDMGHPHGGDPSIPYNTRKQAEHKAIFKAFEILDNKLKPKKDEKSQEKS